MGIPMTESPSDDDVKSFLLRVIEIEQKYTFVKKGQDTLRKEDLRNLLDEFCK